MPAADRPAREPLRMRTEDAVRMRTEDAVRIAATHVPGPDREVAVVVGHGFAGHRRRPAALAIVDRLSAYAGVIAIDFRGHGESTGRSTVGDAEILDLQAAVECARERGYRRVVTLGFSMGASVAVRHAALTGGVDAVVSVSGPARWFDRSTRAMRRVHWACEAPMGRLATRLVLHIRLERCWDPVPLSPVEVVGRIAPVPLLIVHGDQDAFFTLEHPRALAAAAGPSAQLWIETGMGHAEEATTPRLVDRIGGWGRAAATGPAS
ncbi:MAG: alpha/beta hydrolase [Mycobacteriales bacterium]